MTNRPLAFLAVALAAWTPLAACEAKPRTEQKASVRLHPLTVTTAQGARRYRVELAVTMDEQQRGLMFRTSLPRDGGMLFPFRRPRQTAFWMRNTLIPLDMIFIRADGTIARIAANTTPKSLALVDSGEPVTAVLEIAGGGAAKAGIREGDRVSWPALPLPEDANNG